jgi:hypothetical protein
VTDVSATNGAGQGDSGGTRAAVSLLGALGLLTALLAAFATANNGVGRIELNERLFLLIGTWLVLLALVLGGAFFAVQGMEGAGRWKAGANVCLIFGLVFLGFGLGVASYAAVTHVSGRPAITAKFRADKALGLVLTGAVSVSDMSSTTHLSVRVIALSPGTVKGTSKGGLVGTPIYSAAFGPNSSGDVAQTYEVVLPEKARQVLVKAWTGSLGRGYCFDSEIPTGTPPENIKNNLGCVRMRVPPQGKASKN